MPSPLEVLENDWIQWCVLLPRDISGPEFDPIRESAFVAIDALERKGWTHGDVKPSNMMVSAEGHVTLLDLGYAQPIGERLYDKQPISIVGDVAAQKPGNGGDSHGG